MFNKNRKCIETVYALPGITAAFYFGLSTNLTYLKIAFKILTIPSIIILLVCTWMSYSGITRVKVLASNLIYLLIINVLGRLTRFYSGIITFVLIGIVIFLYKKFLKRF